MNGLSTQRGAFVMKYDFAAIEKKCSNVKVVHVLSDDPDWQGEKGFISKEIIEMGNKYGKM